MMYLMNDNFSSNVYLYDISFFKFLLFYFNIYLTLISLELICSIYIHMDYISFILGSKFVYECIDKILIVPFCNQIIYVKPKS